MDEFLEDCKAENQKGIIITNYIPIKDIISQRGTVLFNSNKTYEFAGRQTEDELGCIRVFTEKDMKKLFCKEE